MTTTNNGSDAHLRDNQTTPSKQNGNIKGDDMNESSTSTAGSAPAATAAEGSTSGETTKPQEPSLEQSYFYGLTIDDAVNSAENLMELFYNACKYNHLEIVKRCVEEKHTNVNEPFNNDYPLCIARYICVILICDYFLFLFLAIKVILK
jgi:hypothetical protein